MSKPQGLGRGAIYLVQYAPGRRSGRRSARGPGRNCDFDFPYRFYAQLFHVYIMATTAAFHNLLASVRTSSAGVAQSERAIVTSAVPSHLDAFNELAKNLERAGRKGEVHPCCTLPVLLFV